MAALASRPSNQRAVEAIARLVIGQDIGDRLPTAQELQSTLDVGAGTVQKAFTLLEASGALTTRSRGHQGRFVEKRNLGQLWPLAGLPPAKVILTPPGAQETYGLATALELEFARLGVPLDIDYLHGGSARIARILEHDTACAVLSAGAARASCEQQPGVLRQCSLAPGSCYAPDSVVVLRRESGQNATEPRIGIDPSSFDHSTFTLAQFGELAEGTRMELPFPAIPAAILRGDIDVAVWHRMLMLIPPDLAGLVEEPLAPRAAKRVDECGAASLVAPATSALMRTLFAELDLRAIAEEQTTTMERMSINDPTTWYR